MILLLAGCAQFEFVLDVADLFTEDPAPIAYHQAVVESVTIGADKKMVFFEDGYNFEITNYADIKPGDIISVYREKDGTFTARVDP